MRFRRRSIVLALLLSVVAFVAPIVVPILPARAATDPTVAALNWLERELSANGHRVPSDFGDEFTDWGLTIDFILALAGGQRGKSAETTATTANVMNNALSYVTGVDFGSPDERYAGPLGKLLFVAKVQGVSTTNLGGLDIEAELRARMQTSGPLQGRFSDVSAFGDFSNGFGQAFAVLSLNRTTGGVPPEAVTFLLAQQCPAGGFRLFYDGGDRCTTDGEADTDATAMAIEALLVQSGAPGASASLNRALGWLVRQQDSATGAFAGTGPTATPNANTTGLAAKALLAARQASAANKAGVWIQSLQLTEANAGDGPAAADIGAIAYDPASRDAALAGGIPAEGRDQVRRATAQGVLALPQPVSEGGLGGATGAVAATISTTSAQPGQEVTISANGFEPGEAVDVTLFSDPVLLGTPVADAAGRITFAFKVPPDTTPGEHRVDLRGRASGKSISLSLQVTPSTTTTTTTTTTPTTTVPGASTSTLPAPVPTTVSQASGSGSGGEVLPTTGAESEHHAEIAVALIVLGTMLVAVARRARSVS
jgi:hypothetical protein